MGGTYKFSAQESDFAPFGIKWDQSQITSDIKPPLVHGGLFCRRGSLLFIPDDKNAMPACLFSIFTLFAIL